APTSPRMAASTGAASPAHGARTLRCGCAWTTAAGWNSRTRSTATACRTSTARSATSSCAAATASGPTSWRWWWTMPHRASPMSCAAPTCSTRPRARSCCSGAWACPRPATPTCRWYRGRTVASCPSRWPRWQSTTTRRCRRWPVPGRRWDRIPERSPAQPPRRASWTWPWAHSTPRASRAGRTRFPPRCTTRLSRSGTRLCAVPRQRRNGSAGDKDMTTRVALVTGGTGGIGTAICRRLADQGHKVATNYRSEDKARAWEAQMKSEGYDFTLVKGDIGTPEEAEAMVRAVEDKLGPVEILVNNAGITRDGTFHKMKPAQWHDVINTNLNSVYNVTRPVIEGMRERKWGRIIQISSINGLKGQYGQANYAAAKAGMHGFTISLARENAKLGITVNTVS